MGRIDQGPEQRLDQRTEARRAYEWSRWSWASTRALWSLPMLAVFVALSPRTQLALAMAAGVFTLVTFFLWRGQSLGEAVLPGIVSGLVPFGFALAVRNAGHCAMVNGECISWCAPACACGGVLAAGLIARAARGRDVRFWAGANALAIGVGAFGCACVSWHGSLALAAAMLITAPPAWKWASQTR